MAAERPKFAFPVRRGAAGLPRRAHLLARGGPAPRHDGAATVVALTGAQALSPWSERSERKGPDGRRQGDSCDAALGGRIGDDPSTQGRVREAELHWYEATGIGR